MSGVSPQPYDTLSFSGSWMVILEVENWQPHYCSTGTRHVTLTVVAGRVYLQPEIKRRMDAHIVAIHLLYLV